MASRKVDLALARVLEILSEGGRQEWHLPGLLWQVNWALDLDDMVSISTLRAAVKLLPAGCVWKKAGRVIVAARHFASSEEIVAALHSLPHWDTDLPVLIERHKPALRAALGLANDWALHQSIEWAARKEGFEYSFYSYGAYVRERRAA